MFATNARYKREAYRGSEFAARILADNGLRVVMKAVVFPEFYLGRLSNFSIPIHVFRATIQF